MARRRDFLKGLTSLCGLAACARGQGTAPRPVRARHWEPLAGKLVRCGLCPHGCTIADGKTGTCRVRRNQGGELMTLGYADPCAINVDPIEKKPFYHVTPGARAYSLAVAGCNFRCKNCQNWTISQSSPLDTRNYDLPPQKAVEEAKRSGCTAIAYTYSEPTVWFEYMYDTCKLARAAGLKNVLVTCGYINEGPLRELAQYLDAATVDLKSFDNRIY